MPIQDQETAFGLLLDLLPEDLKKWLKNQPPEVQQKAVQQAGAKGLDLDIGNMNLSDVRGTKSLFAEGQDVADGVARQEKAAEVVRSMQGSAGS
ncbi:hypothetical protein [Streptomyces subrutilus]|uniref:hypothetical protein n=1 Tax=Streptomyces subrutilus TaxID=36818 RepID=UPI0033F5DCEC